MDKNKYINDLFLSYKDLLKQETKRDRKPQQDKLTFNILLTLDSYKDDLTKITTDIDKIINASEGEAKDKLKSLIEEIIKINAFKEHSELYEIFVKYIINDYASTELERRQLILKSEQAIIKSEDLGVEKIKILKQLQKDINAFKDILDVLSSSTKTDDDDDNIKIDDLKRYINNIYLKLLEYYKKYTSLFKPDIILLDKNIAYKNIPDVMEQIEGFDINDLKDMKNNIPLKYKDVEAFIKTYTNSDKDLTNLTEDEKKKIKSKLASFDKLLNANTGQWKTDMIKDKDYKDTLIDLQNKYTSLLGIVDSSKIEVKKEYSELSKLNERLKSINNKIKQKQKIHEDDLIFIEDFDELIGKMEKNELFKDDKDYQNEIEKVKDLYKQLKKGDLSEEKIKEFETANKDEMKKTGKEKIIRKNVIYFEDYTSIFTIILYYITLASIIILFSIVILSLISLCKLIYEIVLYIIAMFVNDKMTKSLSIDYLSKNIIKCTKDNLNDDLFYIIFEQKQNITLFNIGSYIIYLLLVYLLLYIILNVFAKYSNQEFSGNLYNIDRSSLLLTIAGIIILYSFFHLMLYKLLYKPFVYIPYKELNDKENKVDDKIAEYILIYSDNTNENKEILIDDNFFEIIYDLTRIEELNTIFMNGVKSNNKDNCLEQKIIIYDIYMYLREYVVFDNSMKEKFKEYCTSTTENKPNYDNTNNKITFLSLLNNNEVKMIKKYHEELSFFNEIPDDKIEYYNDLNKSINNKIKEINVEIITHNKTLVPFFITVVYILLIVIFNLIIFYIIMTFILTTPKNDVENPFNYYFVMIAFFIKNNIYDNIYNKIINNNRK